MAQRADALRDLVFVMVGLKSGLIDRDALVIAFSAWDCGRDGPLLETLVRRGDLSDSQLQLLDKLVGEHVRAFGGALPGLLPTLGSGPRRDEDATIPEGDGPGGTVADGGRTVFGRKAGGDDGSFSVGLVSPGQERFSVLRPHKAGGLGVVSLALDAELNREVALKQIHDKYADDPTSRGRFVLEAEITGALEHPGIVPVYGLGTYGDGRPYYVMRFIRGESLKDAVERFHADPALAADPVERRLELRKLLRRFVDVCNTIEYAHGRGVLHRDIKPANIMVGQYGETLVVDWGIAKATGRPDVASRRGERPFIPKSASGSTETLPGSALGTPSYMSPEQAAGELDRLGPASDVYSLGATLYTILTNKPAFDSGDIRVVLRAVDRGDFPPPRRHDASIDPALESVCLKAMALKPADRYPTAHDLAEDVELWLADEPVSARPEPVPEKVRRWMRRRRTAVTSAAAGVLVAVVSLVVLLVMQAAHNVKLQRSNHEVEAANRGLKAANDRVREQFEVAMGAIRTFHTGVSEDVLVTEPAFVELRNKLLGEAVAFYQRLQTKLRGQTDRPSRAALALAYFEVGDLTSRIGDKDAALLAHRNALDLREALAREPGGGAAAGVDVARSVLAIAKIEQETRGRQKEAEAGYERAMGLLKTLKREFPEDPAVRAELGRCLVLYGRLLLASQRAGRALESFEQARDLWKSVVTPDAGVEPLGELAWCHHLIGRCQDQNDNFDLALAAYVRAREIRRGLAAAHPENARLQADLAASDNTIGRLYLKADRATDALEEFRKATRVREALTAKHAAVTEFQIALARSYHNTASALSMLGRREAALESFRKAIGVLEPLRRSHPDHGVVQRDLAAALGDMAFDVYRTGRPADALDAFRRARAAQQELVDAEPNTSEYRRNLAISHLSIGRILSESGRTEEALGSYAKARGHLATLAFAPGAPKSSQSELGSCEASLGRVLAEVGRPGDALACFGRALAVLRPLVDGTAGHVAARAALAGCLESYGGVLVDQDRRPDGLAALAEARRLFEALHDAQPSLPYYRSSLAACDDRLGVAATEDGRPGDAVAAHERAQAAWAALRAADPDSDEYREGAGYNLRGFARAWSKLGKTADAASAYDRAQATAEALADANPGSPRYQLGAAASDVEAAEFLARSGHRTDAEARLKRALARLAGLSALEAGGLVLQSRAHALLCGLATDAGADGDAAVDALRRARDAGFRDPVAVARDHAFDAVRDRPDFAAILPDLAFPVDPFTTAP